MFNTRNFQRTCISAHCELYTKNQEKISEGEILNLSQGGLLLAKNTALENLNVGDFLIISLKNKNNEEFTVFGIVLRTQERSIAIKFDGLTSTQIKNIEKISKESIEEQKLCNKT